MDTQICLSLVNMRTELEKNKESFDLRLASSRWSNHDNGDAARVKQPPRHGTVELGGRHVVIFRYIVDAVDEG